MDCQHEGPCPEPYTLPSGSVRENPSHCHVCKGGISPNHRDRLVGGLYRIDGRDICEDCDPAMQRQRAMEKPIETIPEHGTKVFYLRSFEGEGVHVLDGTIERIPGMDEFFRVKWDDYASDLAGKEDVFLFKTGAASEAIRRNLAKQRYHEESVRKLKKTIKIQLKQQFE